jgi:hypothetical protein
MPSLPRAVLTAAALAVVAAAPAAQADSISYIKGGNVHLTTPDGARDHVVTTAGGYSYASQADDGRILALHGKRFQLMDRWGQVQADFSPIADGTAGTVTVNGPYDPVISPDGTKVAYGMYVQYAHGDPGCGLPGGCWEGHLYAATGYSTSTGPGDWRDPAFSPNYGWMDPAWIDDSRTLLSAPSSAYLSHTGVAVPAAGRLSARATRRGKTLATAATRAVAAGPLTLTLKAGKPLPRRARLTVGVTLRTAGGRTQEVTLKVTR